jgi:hypothetical protein
MGEGEQPTLQDLMARLEAVKRAAAELRVAIADYRMRRALARLNQAQVLASQAPVTPVYGEKLSENLGAEAG